MSNDTIVHDTIVIDRHFPVAPSRVFAAYADVDVRTIWGAPSEEDAIEYSRSDFRIGGEDEFRCGPEGSMDYLGKSRYEEILENERIVFVETIRHHEQTLSISLVTWLLQPESNGTRLVLTIQIVSLVGADMIEGSKHGYAGAIKNLAKQLSK